MTKTKSRSSTPSTLARRERQIMDILYRRGRATAAEVMGELPGDPSDSTVRTQLRVSKKKGMSATRSRGCVTSTSRRCRGARPGNRRCDTWWTPSSTARRNRRSPRCSAVKRARLSDTELIDCELHRESTKGTDAMSLLMATTLKVSIVLLCALAAATSLRRRSAALRHWLLAAAIGAAAMAPMLPSIAPAWNIPRMRLSPSSIDDAALPAGCQELVSDEYRGAVHHGSAEFAATELDSNRGVAGGGLAWRGWLRPADARCRSVQATRLAARAEPWTKAEGLRLLREFSRASGVARRVTLWQIDHRGCSVPGDSDVR